MEVILLEKIRNLGNLGDQVKVKPGYARNFLIPYGRAVIANEKNKAEFEARRAELETVQVGTLTDAKARAENMTGASVAITSRASEEGKLFGSVGPKEIAEAMTAAGFGVSRAEIQLSQGPIKETGEYEVKISLHPEVSVSVNISVTAEA